MKEVKFTIVLQTYGKSPTSCTSAKALQVLFRPAVITTLTMNAHTAPNAEIPSSTSAKKLSLQIMKVYRAVIIIGRWSGSEPTLSYKQHDFSIYIFYIYIRSTIRRALNLLRASFSPIFLYFSAVNVTRVSFSPVFQYFVTYVVYVYTYAMRHGIVLSAMDSSTLNSLAMDSSAMDSSAIGVQCRCCCTCM